jgi:Repeat of unknown function (DUF5648)
MNSSLYRLKVQFFAAVSVVCAVATTHVASAFPILTPASGTVVEYFNVHTGHYFMTVNGQEAAGIDAGAAGPGWVRTGFGFSAFIDPAPPGYVPAPGWTVSRFYAPGPNSHFFTLDPAEAATLKQPGSGWIHEGPAFAIGKPDANGSCTGGYAPVVRLYNNRFAQNDSNHRYVTNEAERARMVAKGWIDEGVKFCSADAGEIPIKSFRFDPQLWNGKILPSAACEDETRNLGACMAVNNLPVPATPISLSGPPPFESTEQTLYYGMVTGFTTFFTFKSGDLPDPVAATNVFVQGIGGTYGIHVDTIQRGPALLSSVNPLYQFKTTAAPGAPDMRFFPFAAVYETDAEISVKFIAQVRTLKTRNPASHAYGHPTLEFTDQGSGHNLYFTVLTYGTVAPVDFVAPDLGTGKVIVGTTFRDGSPYLRNFGRGTLQLPRQFVSADVSGERGVFEFRMNRDEFQRVLDAARAVDGALSANPADYLLDNYHFNNEVYGDGEIGLNLGGLRLEMLRR